MLGILSVTQQRLVSDELFWSLGGPSVSNTDTYDEYC